jgi:hypothetical protein
VALPPFLPAAAFCAFVPPRAVPDREVLAAERDLEVPEDAAREVLDVEREFPDVARFFAVADVDRDFVVPVERAFVVPVERAFVPDVDRDFVVPVERAFVVPDVDLDFAAVALPPLRPAAFFWAVVPPRLDDVRDAARVPDEDAREELERDAVDRDELEDERDFAAVALPPLLPAAFFCAVVPRFAEVDRLEAVLDLARLDVARGEAARTREIPSSVDASTGASNSFSKGASECLPSSK